MISKQYRSILVGFLCFSFLSAGAMYKPGDKITDADWDLANARPLTDQERKASDEELNAIFAQIDATKEKDAKNARAALKREDVSEKEQKAADEEIELIFASDEDEQVENRESDADDEDGEEWQKDDAAAQALVAEVQARRKIAQRVEEELAQLKKRKQDYDRIYRKPFSSKAAKRGEATVETQLKKLKDEYSKLLTKRDEAYSFDLQYILMLTAKCNAVLDPLNDEKFGIFLTTLQKIDKKQFVKTKINSSGFIIINHEIFSAIKDMTRQTHAIYQGDVSGLFTMFEDRYVNNQSMRKKVEDAIYVALDDIDAREKQRKEQLNDEAEEDRKAAEALQKEEDSKAAKNRQDQSLQAALEESMGDQKSKMQNDVDAMMREFQGKSAHSSDVEKAIEASVIEASRKEEKERRAREEEDKALAIALSASMQPQQLPNQINQNPTPAVTIPAPLPRVAVGAPVNDNAQAIHQTQVPQAKSWWQNRWVLGAGLATTIAVAGGILYWFKFKKSR